MTNNHFTGRQDSVKVLQSVLLGNESKGNLTIQTIDGPGGIGKSYLLDHVMKNVNLSQRKYLTLKVNGNKGFPRSLASCIDDLVTFADAVPLKKKPSKHYFAQTQNVLKANNELVTDIEQEAIKLKIDIKASKEILEFILQVGSKLPLPIPGFDLKKWQEIYNRLKPAIDQMDNPVISLPIPDWMIPGRTLRNLLKQDPCIPLAQALTIDLTTILYDYPKTALLKVVHPKLAGIDRLLLIIDDYESLQYPMGDFLLKHFLPALTAAPFESLVIIISRDQVDLTNPAWSQNFTQYMLPGMEVTPLSREEMDSLVESFGCQSHHEKERAWQDTQGYPYLVQLWVEEAGGGGSSTIATLQKFYERTTRWMNEAEREWLQYVIFLDEVNIKTLKAVLPEYISPKTVMNWFQKEGSIRDPNAEIYQVRKFIRSRLCDYIKKYDPERYEELRRQAVMQQTE